jgi:hypothetical protein
MIRKEEKSRANIITKAFPTCPVVQQFHPWASQKKT